MTATIENSDSRPGYRTFPGDIVFTVEDVELSRIAGEKVFRFGKWKGARIGFVSEKDPGYLDWLAGQLWFHQKHKRLVTAIKSLDDFDSVVAGYELGWEDAEERARKADHSRLAPQESISRTPRLRPLGIVADVTRLAGGCELIRPARWSRPQ